MGKVRKEGSREREGYWNCSEEEMEWKDIVISVLEGR